MSGARMSKKSSQEREFFTKRSTSRKDRESSPVDDTFTASDYLVGNTIDNIEETLKLVRENAGNRIRNNSLVALSPDHESSEDEKSPNESSISQLLKSVREVEKKTSKKNGDDRPATVPLRSTPTINSDANLALRSTSGVRELRPNTRKTSLSKKIEKRTKKKLSNVSIRRQIHHTEGPKAFSVLKGPIRVETSRMILRKPHADIVIEDRIELIGCGERNKPSDLQKLIPITQSYNSQDVQSIRPSSTQSVSVGNNYILIERTLVLKQLPILHSKSKQFEEKRSFRSQRAPRGEQTLRRTAKSENELDKTAVFNLCGLIEVVSTQQTVANSNREYILLDSIELRSDGSTAQPQQELIPFKGEVKQPPGSDTKVAACKYDEHIYIGRNVILVQRDIRMPPSESYYLEPFSFSDSRSYSTDTTVSTLPTTSDEKQHSCLPRLSDCSTANSPADSTAKSPTKSSDSTARSPTYDTAKSQRSFGSLSPVSPRKNETSFLEDALPKDEGPIQLFSVISKSKKGTAKGTIRDFELTPPSSIIHSDDRKGEDVLRSSTFISDSKRHRPSLIGSPLKVETATSPNETLNSARENQTDPLVTSAPQTPPLELGRMDKTLPEVLRSENGTVRTASPPSGRSLPTRFSTVIEATIPESSTRRCMKKGHRRKPCSSSAGTGTGIASASDTHKEIMVKDGQQLKPILLKHLSDVRERKAVLRSLPLTSEELTIPYSADFPTEKCSSEDASKNMEELSQGTVKEGKKASKEGKGIRHDDKEFKGDGLVHKWKKYSRSASQETPVCHVLSNKETKSQRARSRSAEASKGANSVSTKTAKTFSAESVLSVRKSHQREMVSAPKRKERKCTAELLKTARQISEDSLKTALERKKDLPTLSQPRLQMAKRGSKRKATSLNTAQKNDTISRQLRRSTVESKSPLIRVETKEPQRLLKTTQKHRKLPTIKAVEQKTLLHTGREEGKFIKVRGTDDLSGRREKKPLSLESRLRNKQTDEAAVKRNLISSGERQRPKSNEGAALRTVGEKPDREMRRSLRSEGLQVSKKYSLETAREADQISSSSSSSSILRGNASRINERSLFSKNTLNKRKIDSRRRHPRIWDASGPVTKMDGSFERMKTQNMGDEKKERKSRDGKSVCEGAIQQNMAKLQPIEKRGISDEEDRQISSEISCEYRTNIPTEEKYDGDELRTASAPSISERELLKKGMVLERKTSRLSRRNVEVSTAQRDKQLKTATCISPRRSTSKAMGLSRTKKDVLNDGDEIIIEAVGAHNIKISLNMTIRMKTSGEQREPTFHSLTPNRILLGGREVYADKKHL
uniref:Uncharacterized protein n=1 Tax=Parascaris univalens TaxID=6257 RepID=A0A915CF11_PARUN